MAPADMRTEHVDVRLKPTWYPINVLFFHTSKVPIGGYRALFLFTCKCVLGYRSHNVPRTSAFSNSNRSAVSQYFLTRIRKIEDYYQVYVRLFFYLIVYIQLQTILPTFEHLHHLIKRKWQRGCDFNFANFIEFIKIFALRDILVFKLFGWHKR